MVLANHLIFTTYGFWLPNDHRGSWSEFVRSWEIWWFGDATKTDERHSLARRPHDRRLREVQKNQLLYEPVRFTGKQALCIARGFARAVAESGYVVHACSILPQHVHMVVRRHATPGERIIGHMKARATQELLAAQSHPMADFRDAQDRVPSVWAHRGWKVFLDKEDNVQRAVEYVEENPVKDGKRMQKWSFVTNG